MTDHRKQLSKELRQAGASGSEIEALLPVAASLHLLQPEAPATEAARWWQRAWKPALLVIPGLVIGMALIIVSQGVLPTSWLYPVQKLSDNIATAMHPPYRAEVMMKRARQVNELVAAHASSDIVLATLASYTGEARTYKSSAHASYAAFEFCKANLQQAAGSAPPVVRQAITTSLRSLSS